MNSKPIFIMTIIITLLGIIFVTFSFDQTALTDQGGDPNNSASKLELLILTYALYWIENHLLYRLTACEEDSFFIMTCMYLIMVSEILAHFLNMDSDNLKKR